MESEFCAERDNPNQCCQRRKRKKGLRSVGALSANKMWALMKKGTNGEKLQICMYSPRLKSINMNTKYIKKKVEENL